MDRLEHSSNESIVQMIDTDRDATIYIVNLNSDIRSASVSICAYRVIRII